MALEVRVGCEYNVVKEDKQNNFAVNAFIIKRRKRNLNL